MQDPQIRAAIAEDEPHLKALYEAAFPDEQLFPVVARLIVEVPEVLSLAAVVEGQCVGHILFTPCRVDGSVSTVALLGPLAVLPSWQRRGVGSALVREGLSHIARTAMRHVLVLGDPAYYRRFGFKPEDRIHPPYDLPVAWTGAWQSLALEPRRTAIAGTLCPPDPWLTPSLWAP